MESTKLILAYIVQIVRFNPNICGTNWTKYFLQIVELKD
ncbi:uncharacterized protein METZ01_LOCUS65196 [marine metagenome]|uniref:Uncharacterized protein n=1 Tax=marine metagenome TaxID=408172 RepID=A0A381T848_9ZZZZ